VAYTPVTNKIVRQGEPRGHWREGTLATGFTPKPGTIMELNAHGISGRDKWIPWSKATGAYGAIAVLCNFENEGQLITTAFVDSARILLYFPVPGEELYLLYQDIAGTADDVAFGGLLSVTQTTGKLILNSAHAFPCFTAMEDYVDPAADKLIAVMFNG
jgi:hypothetical protein